MTLSLNANLSGPHVLMAGECPHHWRRHPCCTQAHTFYNLHKRFVVFKSPELFPLILQSMLLCSYILCLIIGKKLLRRRQREWSQNNGIYNEKTISLHVRFKFWYISSPYSAKRQREMNKFKVLWRT